MQSDARAREETAIGGRWGKGEEEKRSSERKRVKDAGRRGEGKWTLAQLANTP